MKPCLNFAASPVELHEGVQAKHSSSSTHLPVEVFCIMLGGPCSFGYIGTECHSLLGRFRRPNNLSHAWPCRGSGGVRGSARLREECCCVPGGWQSGLAGLRP